MSPSELNRLIDAAQVVQAHVVHAGYAWEEVFPGHRAPFNPPDALPDAPVATRCDALLPLLIAWPVQEVGLSVLLETVQREMGLQETWPEFYSQQERAVRQGWLHFRGRDHAYLTESGRLATFTTCDVR